MPDKTQVRKLERIHKQLSVLIEEHHTERNQHVTDVNLE